MIPNLLTVLAGPLWTPSTGPNYLTAETTGAGSTRRPPATTTQGEAVATTTVATISPSDLLGVVHDITRTMPVPDGTTLNVSVSNYGHAIGGQIDIHGGTHEFLSAVLARFGDPRYLGEHMQGTSIRQTRVAQWDTATDDDQTPAHLRGGITITHYSREESA